MKVSAGLYRFVAPNVADDARLGFARLSAEEARPEAGVLGPEEIISGLFILTHDKNPDVSTAAHKSLSEFPSDRMISALERQMDPLVLDYLSVLCKDNDAAIDMIAMNPGVSEKTLIHLAEHGPAEVIMFLWDERERILKAPALLDALKKNPLSSTLLLSNLEEYVKSGGNAPSVAADKGLKKEEFEEVKRFFDTGGDAPAPPSEAAEAAPAAPAEPVAEAEEEARPKAPEAKKVEDKSNNIYKMAGSMTFGQKIKLALMGNKSAREYFAKDSNKLIAAAVLKNPRISDGEVHRIALSKGTSDENLRQIARNKAWMKNYNIRLSLTTNAKTPAAIAMKLLDGLLEKDLQAISKSKNVASVIASAAKRKLESKGKK